MHFVIPRRPGITFAHSWFPGMKKHAQECKPYMYCILLRQLFFVEEFSSIRLRSSVFGCRACVYCKISRHFTLTPLLGRNAISKNANNVVISSPRVIIFSQNIELLHSFPYIWSRDHAHFRPGGAQVFFRIRFSQQPLVRFPKFFSGSSAPPQRALLKFRGSWGRGSNLGARPPKWKFMIFIVTQFPNVKSENGSGCWQRRGSPFIPEILDICCGTIFRENEERKCWGVALFRYHPLGGLPSLIWPLEIVVLGTLAKIVFVRGDRPPFGGDMNFGQFALWPTFSWVTYSRFLKF